MANCSKCKEVGIWKKETDRIPYCKLTNQEISIFWGPIDNTWECPKLVLKKREEVLGKARE